MHDTRNEPLFDENIHLSGMVFDGTWKKAPSTGESIEPATGAVLGHVGLADVPMLEATARAAREAQRSWAAMGPVDRAAIMRRAAQYGERHFDEILGWIRREAGAAELKARFELINSITTIYASAGMPLQSEGRIVPTQDGERLSLAFRKPLGVVGVISPFNVPFYLAMRSVAPALAVGNAVILKPDPRTSISGGLAIARIFELAGMPKGVLSVLPGGGDVGAALCASPDVNMIQFTGSTAAGRKVGEACGRTLKKVSLELGGKNSLIVLDDADMDLAVKNAARSAYAHQGQVCMAAGRILVQENIVEEFTRRLVALSKDITVGDPWTAKVQLGPLIDQHQVDRAVGLLDDARGLGARILTGGTPKGLFFPATVVDGVSSRSRMYHEEVFAPVAMVVPFKDDAEAIALANDTDYGLSGSILTHSMGRALKMQRQLNAGVLHINNSTIDNEMINPFGGSGASGNGTAIGGPADWEEFTMWHWVTMRSESKEFKL